MCKLYALTVTQLTNLFSITIFIKKKKWENYFLCAVEREKIILEGAEACSKNFQPSTAARGELRGAEKEVLIF